MPLEIGYKWGHLLVTSVTTMFIYEPAGQKSYSFNKLSIFFFKLMEPRYVLQDFKMYVPIKLI